MKLRNVFTEDAQQYANLRGLDFAVVLGRFAAHELGHLLLGAGGHSKTGVIHVPWQIHDLERTAHDLICFESRQMQMIRIKARQRISAEDQAGSTSATKR